MTQNNKPNRVRLPLLGSEGRDDRARSRRDREEKSHTITVNRLSYAQVEQYRAEYRRDLEALGGAHPERPKTRAECLGGPRPCPWFSCEFHMRFDIAQSVRSEHFVDDHKAKVSVAKAAWEKAVRAAKVARAKHLRARRAKAAWTSGEDRSESWKVVRARMRPARVALARASQIVRDAYRAMTVAQINASPALKDNFPDWDTNTPETSCLLDAIRNGPMSTTEVGRVLNITRSRVDQIEKYAESLLRARLHEVVEGERRRPVKSTDDNDDGESSQDNESEDDSAWSGDDLTYSMGHIRALAVPFTPNARSDIYLRRGGSYISAGRIEPTLGIGRGLPSKRPA